jgi:hypothetical protein
VSSSADSASGGVLYSIYRTRNAEIIQDLVRSAAKLGWLPALWALDEVSPLLSTYTLGCGPGEKFGLVRELLRLQPPAQGQAVVVADDDVRLHDGGLEDLLRMLIAVGAGIGQPAHARRSHWSHRITRRRWWSRVRLTNFVEIGPLFVVMPRAQHLLDELPRDMGWGLELDWWTQWRQGDLRLAIVDAVSMTHVMPPGSDYALDQLRVETDRKLAQLGYRSWPELQRTVMTWKRWQREPRAA